MHQEPEHEERKEEQAPPAPEQEEQSLAPREQLASAVGNNAMTQIAQGGEHGAAERDLVAGAPMSDTANALAPGEEEKDKEP
jgi:hypothetical protein